MKKKLCNKWVLMSLFCTSIITILLFNTFNIYYAYENWTDNSSQSTEGITVASVDELIKYNPSEGMTIATSGYYSDSPNGSGIYTIEQKNGRTSNGGTIIKLDNGLVACLQLSDDTVSVEQFGAKGDGVTDNTTILNQAFNSGVSNILLKENASYKATDKLLLTTSNMTIKGNNSILFTDNDYKPFEKYDHNANFILIKTANNITLDGITVISNETKQIGHATQLAVQYGTNITVKNSTFIIPETVLTDTGYKKGYNYCNISVFAGWKNVVIEDCTITNLSGTEIGGLVGFNGFWTTENRDAYFRRNICTYKGHDEILAVFSMDDSTISNVEIKDNVFYNYYQEEDAHSPSHVCFSFGYRDSKLVENIVFENNTIDAKSDHSMMIFGNVTNATICNNKISYTKSTQSADTNPYIFYSEAPAPTADKNITIQNNDITLTGETNTAMGGITSGCFSVSDNTITCNAPIRMLFKNNSKVLGNTITTNCNIKGVTDSIYVFQNNTLIANKPFDFLFQYYSHTLTEDVSIANNIINYNCSTGTGESFLMLNGTTLAGHEIDISNNIINMDTSTGNKTLCYCSVKDDTPQIIRFKDNTLGSFISITTYQNQLPMESIILEGNN